jgi:hypothetical protein
MFQTYAQIQAQQAQAIPTPTETFLERALPMIARGVPVIPLRPRSKAAFLSGWEALATTDADQIAQWGRDNPAFNCGSVAIGKLDGHWFWDVDQADAIQRMEADTGQKVPVTLTVKSSGDKRHLYFKHSAASLAMGNLVHGEYSVRANNQYVVSPRSIHEKTGQPYESVTDAPIVEAPAWIIAWLIRDSEKKITAAPIDERVYEGSRNVSLTVYAGKLRHAGATQAELEAALRERNRMYVPPLDDAEVLAVAGSISRYEPGKDETVLVGGVPAGTAVAPKTAAPEPVFNAALLQLPEGKSAIRPFEDLKDVSDRSKTSWIFQNLRVTAEELSSKPQSWIINEMLLEHGLHLFSGKAGSMKSMLALMLAKAAACSEPFLLRENIGAATPVVYIDRENPESEQRKRCAALGLLHLDNFRIWGDWREEWPPPLTFDDPRLIESAQRDNPLFVFDSLSSYLNGADENNTGEMMQIMAKARSLARMSAGVIILHHTPKNGPPSARGNTAITASTDMAFLVSKDGRKVTLKEDRFRPCAGYQMTFEMDFGGITGVYTSKLVTDTARSIEPTSKLEELMADDHLATEAATRQHHFQRAEEIIRQQYDKGEAVTSRTILCGLLGLSDNSTFAKRHLNGDEDNPWTCVQYGRSLAFLPKGMTEMPNKTKPQDAKPGRSSA